MFRKKNCTGWRRITAVSVLLLGMAGAAKAEPREPQMSFARTVWRVDAGLPENTVQSLVVAQDGALWIGTTGGLVRFDGFTMHPMGDQTNQLPARSVFALGADHHGNIWAGTEGSGLLRFHDGEVRTLGTEDGMAGRFVRRILEDSRGRVWVSRDDALLRVNGDRLEYPAELGDDAHIGYHALTEDREGTLFAGGVHLIALTRDGKLHHLPLPDMHGENRVKSLLAASDGTLWIGTIRGLVSMRDGRFRVYPNIHVTVRSLFQSSDGALWIGTLGQGLWTMRDGLLSRIADPHLLPSQTILTVLQDGHGQMWVGTQAGLVRLVRTPIHRIPVPADGDPDYQTLSIDKDSTLWLASEDTFSVRHGEVKRVRFPGVGELPVRAIYPARDGALWIGTEGLGAFRVQNGHATRFLRPASLSQNFVRGFMQSRAGDIWVMTDGGVNRISGSQVDQFTAGHGLGRGSIRSIMEAADGAIWVGTDEGVYVWRGGTMQEEPALHALKNEKVWSMLQDRKGVLWFATRDHGLYRLRGGVLAHFGKAEGLPDESFYAILQDPAGRFWLCTPNAIFWASETEMDQPLPSGRLLAVSVLPMPFGAEDIQFYGGRQPSGVVDKDGSVWFATNRGLIHIAAPEWTPTELPQLSLHAIDEDGRQVPASAELHLGAGVKRVTFDMSAVSLLPANRWQFRYRLDSFDREWQPSSSPTATYTNLPPGSYRFRMAAVDVEQPTHVREFDLPVTKETVFYQRWWFYAVCLLAAGFAAWIIYRLRVRQMKTRFRAVLDERSRLAREMHDTVIQRCTGVSALLEGMATIDLENVEAREDLLNLARTQVSTTITEARQAVWDLRHEHEESLDLIDAVRGLTAQTMSEFGNEIAVSHDVPTLPIKVSAAHELLMAMREAIYNSVQHSGVSRVDVALRVRQDNLAISIEDLGRGFVPEIANGHFGLIGMSERVRRLGGSFDLQTAPDKGTRITMSVRLVAAVGSSAWSQ